MRISNKSLATGRRRRPSKASVVPEKTDAENHADEKQQKPTGRGCRPSKAPWPQRRLMLRRTTWTRSSRMSLLERYVALAAKAPVAPEKTVPEDDHAYEKQRKPAGRGRCPYKASVNPDETNAEERHLDTAIETLQKSSAQRPIYSSSRRRIDRS